ncbi:MAG: acylneuraminate cytidylyltransferase family protein [Alphaproteobacteria bacterium]|nr:acylneuraminate cytidylyltransferase family protein [Alphaproteobacteria bacterium]
MQRIAIIPVKRRSRRLPEKNIRLFNGAPMFVHTIAAAQDSELFSRIVVSTSDPEIMATARANGAEVHTRDVELDKDAARLVEVCTAVLDAETAMSRDYDLMVLLMATAPLRTAADIVSVVDLAEREPSGGALAVTKYSHPAHQALKVDADGTAGAMWPDLVAKREEEMPQLRVDNGSTYALHVGSFLEEKTFYVKSLRAYEMPRHRSVDLDDMEDLALLEFYAGLDDGRSGHQPA